MESQAAQQAIPPHSFVGAQPSMAAVLPPDETISIQHCYSCRGKHEHLPLKAYTAEHLPWTHWFTCPTTGDPTPLCIVQAKDRKIDVSNDILRNVVRAMHAGSYMVCVFRSEGGKIHLDRITHDFAKADMPRAIDLLNKNLESEMGLPKGNPLPEAKLSPRPSIFDAAKATGGIIREAGDQVIDLSRTPSAAELASPSADDDESDREGP